MGAKQMTQAKTFIRPEYRIFILVALCVFFFLIHIGIRTLVVTQGYEISEKRKEIAQLESQVAELKLQRSRQRSPAALEKLVEELSLKGKVFSTPKPVQLQYLHGKNND